MFEVASLLDISIFDLYIFLEFFFVGDGASSYVRVVVRDGASSYVRLIPSSWNSSSLAMVLPRTFASLSVSSSWSLLRSQRCFFVRSPRCLFFFVGDGASSYVRVISWSWNSSSLAMVLLRTFASLSVSSTWILLRSQRCFFVRDGASSYVRLVVCIFFLKSSSFVKVLPRTFASLSVSSSSDSSSAVVTSSLAWGEGLT